MQFKAEMFNLYCEVLQLLKEEGLFQQVTNDFYLLVAEGDNGLYDERESYLSKIMSQEDLHSYKAYWEEGY